MKGQVRLSGKGSHVGSAGKDSPEHLPQMLQGWRRMRAGMKPPGAGRSPPGRGQGESSAGGWIKGMSKGCREV